MANGKGKGLVVRVEVGTSSRELPPEASNWVHVTHQGNEVQLLVGYIDAVDVLRAAVIAKKGPAELKLTPAITHRFMLSLSGFLYYRNQFNQLYAKMQAKGIFDAAPSGEEAANAD